MPTAASKTASPAAKARRGGAIPTDTNGSSGERRIQMFVAALMIAAAFVTDFFQFVITAGLVLLPVVGWIAAAAVDISISVMAACWFALWFRFLNVRFLGRISGLTTLVAEALPFFNNLPGWTLGVSWTILMSWREDRRARQQGATEEGAASRPANDNPPPSANENPPRAASGNAPRAERPSVDGIERRRNTIPMAPVRKAA